MRLRLMGLLVWLVTAGVGAQSALESLVLALVASPRETWAKQIQDYAGPIDREALKGILTRGLSLPLEQAGPLAQACDAVAARGQSYDGSAQLALARQLIRQGQRQQALEVVTGLASAHPELTGAQLLRGFCLLESGRYEEARGVFEQVTRATPFSELAWVELGRANVFLNRRSEALAAFREALAINPDNGFARDAVASLSGAAPALRLKANPLAREHFEKAEQLFAQRRFQEAIAEYQQAAQADPSFAKPLVYIGDCYYQLGDAEQAMASYQAALLIDPQDKQAHRFLGEMYERRFDKTGEAAWLEKAIACYQAALKADPSYGAAHNDLRRAQGKQR